MIRSRLLFLGLLLAYISFSPAGVYTCACLIPGEAALSTQTGWEDVSERPLVPDSNSTAVTLFSFFSLSFMVAVVLCLVRRQNNCHDIALLWLEPYQFCEPPPTPPPHFV